MLFRLLAAATVIAAGCIAAPALCSPQQQHPPTAVDSHAPPSTLSVVFPGGNALEYIAALRKAKPEANIVVLGDLAKVHMAAVQLNNVDVWSALRVLDQLPSVQGGANVKVRIENVATSQDVPDVFAVTADVRNRSPEEGPMRTTVISMADLLGDNLKPSDGLTAIETALGLIAGESEPAQIKFHEETGLLIARGSSEQIESIRQVIEQLLERQGTIASREGAEAHAQQMAQQQQMVADRNSTARADNERLTREVIEQRTRAEMLEREVDNLRRQLEIVTTELRQSRAENETLARTVSELQSKVKEPKP